MAASQGCIRVRQQERTVYFQVEGWGTMRQSLSFRLFAERCLAEGAAGLRVDLRHCTYLDSTFLGMLIGLKRAASSLGQDSFALVSPSGRCCQLLQQMGLGRILPQRTEDEAQEGSWIELTNETADTRAFQCTVVQARQELANLEGKAGEAFRQVACCLTEAQEAERVPQT